MLLRPMAAPCDVVLVHDGRPSADIVIADEPAPCVPYAAEELQTHLERMTGARLRIVPESRLADKSDADKILVGDSGWARDLTGGTDGLPPDGFRLVVRPGRLAIVGNEANEFSVNYDRVPASAGTLYGVYRRELSAAEIRRSYEREASRN